MSTQNEVLRVLSPEQVKSFKKDGVVVIPNLLSRDELDEIHRDFDASFEENFGFDPRSVHSTIDNLTSKEASAAIMHLYWSKAQLKAMQHPRIVDAVTDLLSQTYGAADEGDFPHPYGEFDARSVFWYADRVNYRLPDEMYSLSTIPKRKYATGPHIDFLYKTKWRPIQAFLALTPNTCPSTGGFMAVKGFHKRFHSYFPDIESEGIKIRFTEEDSEIMKAFEDIFYDEGCMVFWDCRIPHMTAPQHTGQNFRKVIYTGYLPDIALNRDFVKRQLECFETNVPPPDFNGPSVRKAGSGCCMKPHDDEFTLSEIGLRLLGKDARI
eukprot:TRINITY_DN1499_c0_g1_i1.p1 TRINITY_DN1499_c0_g1~~TRINITY_DN1499_c0_g1_i1.p1  ORF type:complete len:324 (+),score=81.38 TRINITY_DN1499_c0_g1_i1:124-1095(+)